MNKSDTGRATPPMTNADRIRAMSDEELAEWLEPVDCYNCECCVYQKECRFEHDVETVNYAEKYDCCEGRMKWLQQPAEVASDVLMRPDGEAENGQES